MLIDTHILIWILEDTLGVLGPEASNLLHKQPLTVSSASLMEIAVKKRRGKLDAPETQSIIDNLQKKNIDILDIQAHHITNVPSIDTTLHADPFDLLFMAQAITENIPFITCDREILRTTQPGLQLINGYH